MCIKFETAPATIASFLSNKIPLRSEQHELSLAAFATVDEFDVVANGFVSSKILNCRYSAIAVVAQFFSLVLLLRQLLRLSSSGNVFN